MAAPISRSKPFVLCQHFWTRFPPRALLYGLIAYFFLAPSFYAWRFKRAWETADLKTIDRLLVGFRKEECCLDEGRCR